MQREDIVKSYFQSWLDKTIEPLESIFSDDIIYSECYGPEYHGLTQILKWFADWNINGAVLKWKIKKFIHQGMFTVVEWYFECDYNNEIGGFDGVSHRVLRGNGHRSMHYIKSVALRPGTDAGIKICFRGEALHPLFIAGTVLPL